jgi:cytochrome b6-f complex iron-sulfur subunit
MEINGTVSPPQVTTEEIPRRKFMVMAAAVAIFLALAEGLRITFAFLKPQETGGFGSEFFPGSVADFPPGSVTHVRKGRFYVIHGDDGLLAMYQQCTHLGCLVPWNDEEQVFACPCHSGRYNPMGEVIAGPPPRPLDLFQLEIINDELVVDTGKIIQRNEYDPSQAVKI